MEAQTTSPEGEAVSEVENEEPTEPTEPDAPEVDDDPDQDEGDEDTEDAAEASAETEPAPVVDEDRSKLFAKIDRSFNTYKSAVERNLEDELTDWLFCPLCATGSVPGFINRHDLGRVPDEVVANVQTFLGFARETEYEQDPGTATCETCKGKTKVRTGALSGDYITRTCPNCKGYGYMPPPGSSAQHTGTNGSAVEAVSEALADLDTPDRDNWGEPRVLPDGTLNANYGKQPQFKEVHPVFGVTAQLSPEELISG